MTARRRKAPRPVGPTVTTVRQVSCLRCAYWKPDDDIPETGPMRGECRRRQPVVDFDARNMRSHCAWPRTFGTDWCGEFDEQLGLWRSLS
jgi:hypothetical protein